MPAALIPSSSPDPKPQLTLAILGHDGHGKTTLARAIQATFGATEPASLIGSAIDAAFAPLGSPAPSRIEAETDTRTYLIDDYTSRAISAYQRIIGVSSKDGAILVVSAIDGPTPQTREDILLCRQVGVPALVVFLSKTDQVDDDELIQLVAMEIRDLLDQYGYPGATTPVIPGSALRAMQGNARDQSAIRKLLEAADHHIPQPQHAIDQSFLMAVDGIDFISGLGTVVTGRIERGIIRTHDTVEIVGLRPTRQATVKTIVAAIRRTHEARAGANVGILLDIMEPDAVEPGQVIAAPGSVRPHRRFKAEIYILSRDEGGRHTPFFASFRPQFSFPFSRADMTGRIHLPDDKELVFPGDTISTEIELLEPVVMEASSRFSIKEGSRTVGFGVVSRFLEDFPSPAAPYSEETPFSINKPPRVHIEYSSPQKTEPPTEPVPADAPRFVQADVFESRSPQARASSGTFKRFRTGSQHTVEVQIAPISTEHPLLRLADPFPSQHLPPDQEQHELTVHFVPLMLEAQAQRNLLILPRSGSSNLCRFDFIVPAEAELYEARIIVSYQNRILQTARLLGSTDLESSGNHEPISLLPECLARQQFSHLDHGPRFAASFLLNATSSGQNLLTGMDDDGVWLTDRQGIDDFIETFDNLWNGYSYTAAKETDSPWLPSATLREEEIDMLRNAALGGQELHSLLVSRGSDRRLPPGAAIQVFTKTDQDRFPVEFVYESPVGVKSIAELCPDWPRCLEGGCQQDPVPKIFCPSRFWGLSRVIERHHYDVDRVTPASPDFWLRAEPNPQRHTLPLLNYVLLGGSKIVPESLQNPKAMPAIQELARRMAGRAELASSWSHWKDLVAGKPDSLLLLVHTQPLPKVKMVRTLEISGDPELQSNEIDSSIVGGTAEHHPMVLLLGCHTAQGEVPFARISSAMKRCHASVVIGSGSFINARHAAPFAQFFLTTLREKLNGTTALTFGEFMQHLRRESLTQGHLVVLALTAYGDADWILTSAAQTSPPSPTPHA